jgi:hypothetical protein
VKKDCSACFGPFTLPMIGRRATPEISATEDAKSTGILLILHSNVPKHGKLGWTVSREAGNLRIRVVFICSVGGGGSGGWTAAPALSGSGGPSGAFAAR